MELNLVCITHKIDGKRYFGVNDKHYDAMLAGGDLPDMSWDWLGDIIIEDEILEEEGWFKDGKY